jgi:hypothetical protein
MSGFVIYADREDDFGQHYDSANFLHDNMQPDRRVWVGLCTHRLCIWSYGASGLWFAQRPDRHPLWVRPSSRHWLAFTFMEQRQAIA